MDCGATAHIINGQSKFVRMYAFFVRDTYFIELAGGSRSNGTVSAKGDAFVNISDANGKNKQVILTINLLCIPSYSQDIFSVQAATGNGNTI